MILICKAEFRGSSARTDDKGHTYNYVNLEDSSGESAKLSCDSSIDLKNFKKGDSLNFAIDYNSKYGSLKVVDISK